MVVYTVHDIVADTFSFPQVSPTIESAIRDFKALQLRPGVPSDDLEMIVVAEWDDNEGKLFAICHDVVIKAANSGKAQDEV